MSLEINVGMCTDTDQCGGTHEIYAMQLMNFVGTHPDMAFGRLYNTVGSIPFQFVIRIVQNTHSEYNTSQPQTLIHTSHSSPIDTHDPTNPPSRYQSLEPSTHQKTMKFTLHIKTRWFP